MVIGRTAGWLGNWRFMPYGTSILNGLEEVNAVATALKVKLVLILFRVMEVFISDGC